MSNMFGSVVVSKKHIISVPGIQGLFVVELTLVCSLPFLLPGKERCRKDWCQRKGATVSTSQLEWFETNWNNLPMSANVNVDHCGSFQEVPIIRSFEHLPTYRRSNRWQLTYIFFKNQYFHMLRVSTIISASQVGNPFSEPRSSPWPPGDHAAWWDWQRKGFNLSRTLIAHWSMCTGSHGWWGWLIRK